MAKLAAGSGITITKDAPTDTLTISSSVSAGTLDHTDLSDWDEAVQDTVGAALQAGANASVTYDDTAGTITVAVPDEGIDDRVAALLTGGTNVTVDYDDTAGTLTISAAATELGAHDHTSAPGDGGVLTDDEHDGYSEYAAIATPANPDAGKVRLYPKSDKKLYLLDETGAETDLTATGTAGATALDDLSDVALSSPVSGQVLAYDGTSWVNQDAAAGGGGDGFANPMTAEDDLIVGGSSGAATRLAKGSDGQVLTVDPATHHLAWATPASGGGAVSVAGDTGSPFLYDSTTGRSEVTKGAIVTAVADGTITKVIFGIDADSGRSYTARLCACTAVSAPANSTSNGSATVGTVVAQATVTAAAGGVQQLAFAGLAWAVSRGTTYALLISDGSGAAVRSRLASPDKLWGRTVPGWLLRSEGMSAYTTASTSLAGATLTIAGSGGPYQAGWEGTV